MARILVVSPTPSHPQDAGNRARIFSLLGALKAAGHQVYFAFVKMEVGDEASMAKAWDGFFSIRYHPPLRSFPKRIYNRLAIRLAKGKVIPFGIDDWYSAAISRQIADIRRQVKPDVVLVEYVFISKVLECFGPESLKFLDTHDIFGDRHRLFLEAGMSPRWFYTTVSEEKKALDRADLVLAIQKEESAYFKKLTQREVLTVWHLVQPPLETHNRGEETDRLLFVGSANPINVDAFRWFLREVFPLVRRKVPNIELEIVGECAEQIPATEGLILTGRVADLAPCYRRAKVIINPVRFGTGLKIKTIEALAYCRPLVTTSAGAAGLEEWAGKAFLVADSPKKFAETIQKVFSSADLQADLFGGASQFIRKYNQAVMQPLLDVFNRATRGTIPLEKRHHRPPGQRP